MFTSVRPAGRLDNDLHLNNDEQGVGVWIADGPTRPWAELWPEVRRYG
jgi:hypothetical protein